METPFWKMQQVISLRMSAEYSLPSALPARFNSTHASRSNLQAESVSENTRESLAWRFPEGRLHGVTPLTKASNTWHRLQSVKKTRASVPCKCLCTQHVDATSWQVHWQIGCTVDGCW